MPSHLTNEEVEHKYLAEMGPQLGAVYHRLWNECVWLHLKWNEYAALFGRKPERIELLNAAAPGLFRLVQVTLFDDILLHISRFTDQEKVAGRETLTLNRLPRLVESSIRRKVSDLATDANEKAKFARDWRNRAIGHKDLALALNPTVKPLEPASRQKVREAIGAIATLLNSIEGHYLKSVVAYEIIEQQGSAEALLYVLRDGLAARQRLSSGMGPEDHRPI